MKKNIRFSSKHSLLIGLIIIAVISIYFIYNRNSQTVSQSVNVDNTTETTVIQDKTGTEVDTGSESTTEIKKFFDSVLAQYDGKDGNPAYVAVDGAVYDLTRVFRSGSHYGHFAGKELTKAFYMQHIKSEITKYPQVGILE